VEPKDLLQQRGEGQRQQPQPQYEENLQTKTISNVVFASNSNFIFTFSLRTLIGRTQRPSSFWMVPLGPYISRLHFVIYKVKCLSATFKKYNSFFSLTCEKQ